MASNSTITPWQEQIGRTEATIYSSILYTFSFFAVAGNLVVCFTILKVKYLNMAAGHLIISLAVADIMTGSLCMFVHATMLALRTLSIGNVMCNIIGFVKISTICTSLSSLMVISVDRYLCIIYNMTYARQVRRKWIAAVIVWFLACLFASFPIYGWGVYTLLPNKSICTVNWLHDPSFTLVLFTVYGFATITVMFVAYGGIAWRLHQSKVKVQKSIKDGNAEAGNSNTISRDEVKVAKTMSTVVASLVICLTPYVITELVSIGRGTVLHSRVEIYITSILYVNSCLNPWIYGGTHRRFRLAVKSLFGMQTSGNSVGPATNNTST